jgi:hypothetical protein
LTARTSRRLNNTRFISTGASGTLNDGDDDLPIKFALSDIELC